MSLCRLYVPCCVVIPGCTGNDPIHEQCSECVNPRSSYLLSWGICLCMRVFSFHITASCHILTITVSAVLVLIYCPLAASPRVALVGIFCCATLYVSVCVCEGVCRISFMVLVLVLVMCGSLIAARSSTPLLLPPCAF